MKYITLAFSLIFSACAFIQQDAPDCAEHSENSWGQHYSQAYYDSEIKNIDSAKAEIKAAIRATAKFKYNDWRVIETYDDAAYYFYLSNDFYQATRYQATAVLLAWNETAHTALYDTYVGRLKKTFAKYDSTFVVDEVSKNPAILLKEDRLKLAENVHVKRKFGK